MVWALLALIGVPLSLCALGILALVLRNRGRSPAAWKEALCQVDAVTATRANGEARKGIHRLGDDVVIATFGLVPSGTLEVAARAEQEELLLGPFAQQAAEDRDSGRRTPQVTATG